MKMKELREKAEKDLQLMLSEKRAELGKLRFEMKTGEVKNNQQIFMIKKDIARMLTVLHAKSNPLIN